MSPNAEVVAGPPDGCPGDPTVVTPPASVASAAVLDTVSCSPQQLTMPQGSLGSDMAAYTDAAATAGLYVLGSCADAVAEAPGRQQGAFASLQASAARDDKPCLSPEYETDEFRMHCYKVAACSRRTPHDWQSCPFVHPGEHGRRRPLSIIKYSAVLCPYIRKNEHCPLGDACPKSHNVFEAWLHPDKYRTQICIQGTSCKRKVCFFAHTPEELRRPPTAAPNANSKGSAAARAKQGAPPSAHNSTPPPTLSSPSVHGANSTATSAAAGAAMAAANSAAANLNGLSELLSNMRLAAAAGGNGVVPTTSPFAAAPAPAPTPASSPLLAATCVGAGSSFYSSPLPGCAGAAYWPTMDPSAGLTYAAASSAMLLNSQLSSSLQPSASSSTLMMCSSAAMSAVSSSSPLIVFSSMENEDSGGSLAAYASPTTPSVMPAMAFDSAVYAPAISGAYTSAGAPAVAAAGPAMSFWPGLPVGTHLVHDYSCPVPVSGGHFTCSAGMGARDAYALAASLAYSPGEGWRMQGY